jgi:hypothetical protein
MGCNQEFGVVTSYDDGLILCLQCDRLKVERDTIVLTNLERQHNYTLDRMESISGVRLRGRYPERQAPVHVAKVTMTTVKVNDSIIGTINTGVIESLNVNMSNVNMKNTEAASDLKTLSEVIMTIKEITDQQKEELVEQVAFLASQLALEEKKRNVPVVKSVLESITKMLTFSVQAISLVIKIGSWFGIVLAPI